LITLFSFLSRSYREALSGVGGSPHSATAVEIIVSILDQCTIYAEDKDGGCCTGIITLTSEIADPLSDKVIVIHLARHVESNFVINLNAIFMHEEAVITSICCQISYNSISRTCSV